MPRFSRSFAVLLLVFLLLLPAAVQAAEPQSVHSASPSWVSWTVLARLWNLLTDNGCQVDPSGLCRPDTSTTATTDNGCRIEPNGLCRN
jgi:ABC-type proline/glycine betaine transport system substrate-binding protein